MLQRWKLAPRERTVIAVLLLATFVIFGVLVGRMVFGDTGSDYIDHIIFAQKIQQTGGVDSIHLMYQTLILLLAALPVMNVVVAGWVVSVAFYLFTALVLYALLRPVVGRRYWFAAGLSLALLIVAPVSLLTVPARNLYYGYVGINVVHNPTIVLLKPFALLLFAFAIGVIDGSTLLNRRSFAVSTALIALSLFAKPNYVLVLLPALGIIAAWMLLRRDFQQFKALAILLIAPMTVLLALEYVLMYLFIDSDGGIIFDPLLTLITLDGSRARLLLKFLLSILFPLAVTLLYWRQTLRDLKLNVAWLAFFAGAGQMYLFAESGSRLPHGNFWWSAQIGLFVLFVVSTLFWLRQTVDSATWRTRLLTLIFALHLLSGAITLIAQFETAAVGAWW